MLTYHPPRRRQQGITSPLGRIGGKRDSAQRIISLFPPSSSYTTYVEPCFGAGWVLFGKERGKHTEVVSDRDDNLIAFWRALQSQREALLEKLQLPYSRAIYYEYYHSLFNEKTDLTDVERAARFFYALRGTGTGWLRKSPVGWDNCGKSRTAFVNLLKGEFQAVQERIADLLIDNRDILDTVRRYDSPQTLFYVDPPYIGAEQYYEASKKGFPHEEMATLLCEVQGYVALSYYPHPDLEQWYPQEGGWYRTTWQVKKHSQIAGGNRAHPDTATEMLLTNYPPIRNTLWSVEEGDNEEGEEEVEG